MSDLENKKSPVVITIARDFGAEGHEIGRILADELGIPLYDNELLVRASLRAGESLDKMAAYDERLAVENMAFLPDRYDARSYSDKLFQKMSQVILDLGETESCIIGDVYKRQALSKAVCPIICCATTPITSPCW